MQELDWPDVLCIGEHWLQNQNEAETVMIDGYQLTSLFCRESRSGGGVCIYRREDIAARNVVLGLASVEQDFEYCCSEIKTKDATLFIVCVYRAPSGNIQNFIVSLTDILESVYNRCDCLMVSGDFNLDFDSGDCDVSEVLNIFSSFGCRRLVFDATRVTSTSQKCIDNVFANVAYAGVRVGDFNFTDHRYQLVETGFESSQVLSPFIKYCRDFGNDNVDQFLEFLSRETWDIVYDTKVVDNQYDSFLNIFIDYFNQCFPLKSVKCNVRKNKVKWLDPEIINSSHYLKDLFQMSRQFPELKEAYKYQKNKHQELVAASKRTYYNNLIENSRNKSKMIWDILNSKKRKDRKPVTLKCNDESIRDPQRVSELFVEYFSPADAQQNPSHNNTRTSGNLSSLFLYPTDHLEIENIIHDLANKKSCGWDEIPCDVVKKASSYISNPLSDVVNNMFLQSVFPSKLKISKVVPIYKKGNEFDPQSYRPISLLPVFSKIFEKIINNRIMSYLSKFNLLPASQFGFLPKKSTELAAYNFLCTLFEDLDNGKKVLGLYYDFSKAFDNMNHDILLTKLDKIGIRDKAQSLIKSYLEGRQQYVSIIGERDNVKNEYKSQSRVITRGVPQGSILGPVLFLLYVADLPVHFTSGTVFQYADDTSCVVSSDSTRTLSSLASQCNNVLSEWCNCNELTLNDNKSTALYFNNKKDESIYIKLKGRSVPNVASFKFLGFHMDPYLNWRYHCEDVVKKINSSYYVIVSMRNVLGLHVLKTFYYAHVHSRLRYGLIFWGSGIDFESVFRAQKRIMRCILKKPAGTPCRSLFKELGVLPLPCLYVYELIMFVYTNQDKFTRNRDINVGMATRYRDTLSIPSHRTVLYERGPHYRGIKAFNAVPDAIKQARSERSFKISLRNYLLQHCFYSYNEFLNS